MDNENNEIVPMKTFYKLCLSPETLLYNIKFHMESTDKSHSDKLIAIENLIRNSVQKVDVTDKVSNENNTFVEEVAMGNTLVNVYYDDAGQTYVVKFACNGKIREMTCGSFNSDYMDMIEYEFGEPEVDCEYFDKCEKLGKYGECSYKKKGYCDRCTHFDPRESIYQELLSLGIVDKHGKVTEKYKDIVKTIY